jgi:N6-adenosine-specific RNA methylase IME4
MKFQVIVSDPPWQPNDKLNMSDIARGAEANYATMTNADIAALPVKDLADPDGCLLALWCLGSMLQDGMDVMKAYGFEQKQVYVWCKTLKEPLHAIHDNMKASELTGVLAFGMGRLFRQSHEICLIGVNTTKVYKHLENKSQRSVAFARNDEHSHKPECLQDSLDLMFPTATGKLELFSRRSRVGWICRGNECPDSMGEDIRVSIQNLITQP